MKARSPTAYKAISTKTELILLEKDSIITFISTRKFRNLCTKKSVVQYCSTVLQGKGIRV